MSECVTTADVDLDTELPWYSPSKRTGTKGQKGYLAGYYPESIPEKRSDLRAVIFAQRRPELYGPIVEKSLANRAIPGETWEKMAHPPVK